MRDLNRLREQVGVWQTTGRALSDARELAELGEDREPDLAEARRLFARAIETPGGLFFIDAASVLYLIGSTMDWQEDDFTAGFVFDNPNATGSCGCGESFTV